MYLIRKALLYTLDNMRFTLFTLVIFSIPSCTEDRLFIDNNSIDSPTNQDSGKLIINELVAKGSLLTSELGVSSDWIEIYNRGSSSVNLSDGDWFITDDPNNLEKFKLPGWSISPNAFLVIFCNDSNKVGSQIHTNFGLSSNGEKVILSVKKAGKQIQIADSVRFGPQTFDNKSVARSPNAIGNWQYPTDPTPGSANP